MATQTEHLGEISARHEGAGPGTISDGRGDHGGVSYGTYQLSTNSGTLNEYLAQSSYKDSFKGLEPATPDFNEKWKSLASQDSAFGQDQADFIKTTHYDVQVQRLKDDGLDLSGRGHAVKEALFSTSVQYRGLTKNVFEGGLKEAFGDHYDLNKLTDKEIVTAVQDYKTTHNDTLFRSSSATVRAGTLARAGVEKDELIALAEGRPLPDLHARHAKSHEGGALHLGSKGEAVGTLQGQLAALGYTDQLGQPLHADRAFGPGTDHAVRSFQQDHHLTVDGKVGPATLKAISDEIQAQKQAGPQQSQTPGRLDHPDHPDHSFFQQTRDHVFRLDRELGRTPDQQSNNIASALTVQARTDGLHRIDQIALSTDGSRLWAVQSAPGRNDHFFDQRTSVSTAAVNMPMEQSATQWPQAMQQFHHTQQQMQAQTQAHAQVQVQVQDQAQPQVTHGSR